MILGLIAILQASTATVTIPRSDDGSPLVDAGRFEERCSMALSNEGPPEAFGFCLGYIQGIVDRDSRDDRPIICIPSIPRGEVIQAVLNHIRENPRSRNVSVGLVVTVALAQAFPAREDRENCVI